MDKWEYHYEYWKSRTDNDKEITNWLNRMGEMGWELVQVFGGAGQNPGVATIHGFFLKRKLK